MITEDKRIINPILSKPIQIVFGLPNEPFKTGEWVSIDTEWFKMDKKVMHRPHTGKFACITVCPQSEPNTVYIMRNENDVPTLIPYINDAVWVMSNAKFDLTHMRRLAHIPPRKKLYDIQIMEEILYGGYYDMFGLKDTVRRYLHLELDKDLQKSFDVEVMSEEQIEYACIDAWVTLHTALEQKKTVRPEDFNVWKEIELPVLWAVLDFQGARIDIDGWISLSVSHKRKSEALDETLPFNPHSPKQVVAWLKEHGFKNMPDSNEKTIAKFMRKFPNSEAAKISPTILESRGLRKLASTYGKSFIEGHIERDEQFNCDVLFTDYKIRGARDTGRFSSANPNLQNVPARETPVFRQQFIARPGNKIITADYGQQEPRISAFFSQDKAFIAALSDTKNDIYINMVKSMWHIDINKHDPKRKLAKNALLGISYGMSEKGFSDKYGISKEETAEIFRSFFNAFPDYATWLQRQSHIRSSVTTRNGCKLWLNPYSYQAERNARNAPIQGTAAEMMKKAISEIHQNWKTKEWNYPFAIVLQVHDEIVLDVPETIAKEVAAFVQEKMVSVAEKMCPGVPFIASISIGDSWAEKE